MIDKKIVFSPIKASILKKKLANKETIKGFFGELQEHVKYVQIDSITEFIISGTIGYKNIEQFFQISLESQSTVTTSTKVSFVLSRTPLELGGNEQRKLKKENKQKTKNYTYVSIAAAVALVALLIPVGILPGMSEDIQAEDEIRINVAGHLDVGENETIKIQPEKLEENFNTPESEKNTQQSLSLTRTNGDEVQKTGGEPDEKPEEDQDGGHSKSYENLTKSDDESMAQIVGRQDNPPNKKYNEKGDKPNQNNIEEDPTIIENSEEYETSNPKTKKPVQVSNPVLTQPPLLGSITPQSYAIMSFGIMPDGDPLAFAIDGKEACTIRREMGSHDSTYWKLNLYTTNPPIILNMNRSLCDGTFMFGIDRNNSGTLDSGYEILWLQGYDAFEILHNVDYYEGVFDGIFSTNDPLWKDALVMDSDYNYYHPEELGIKAVNYFFDVQRFEDDQYGVGVYADDVGISDNHFRIMAHSKSGIIFEDNSTTELSGIVEGPLWDCTIHDVRYHIAEKKTGLYLRTENPEDPTQSYVDALDFCDDFEEARKHPDKYLSHWIAGIASMEHKKGLSDYNMLQQSKITYEKALSMAPDNHFFNTDYCLVNHQLGYSTDECMPKVLKAIEKRPDVEWFKETYRILTR